MTEGPTEDDKILVMGLKTPYEVTKTRGKPISDLVKFLTTLPCTFPERYRIEVFTMDVREKVPGTILKKERGMLQRSVQEKVQFIIGTLLEVTSEYVITESDLSVTFIDLSS